eukprot:CAMPEP_0180195786 /NCGR_PEP_ID=MMETSP0987-20121128/3768_1 /TAXON_ID=697907 /ORGANISM="non described non described, Strain CCMP2293" /LENGTH=78 /DNA_ID=CAMNT_0022150641 /DNA_START=147 /DNA_END=382 /DNA_ORIENTATION=+
MAILGGWSFLMSEVPLYPPPTRPTDSAAPPARSAQRRVAAHATAGMGTSTMRPRLSRPAKDGFEGSLARAMDVQPSPQ